MKKVVNDLVNYKNLRIVQCKDYFNFSLESVLLPNFVTYNNRYKKIVDLGCGNAPMSLILSTIYSKAKVIGVEIQKEVFDLAIESVKLNNLEDRITILNENIKNLRKEFLPCSFDLVVCNPPYFTKEEKNKLNNNEIKAIARHEIKINLEEIIKMTSYLLNNKGKFAIVHRTEKLVTIFDLLRKYNLEPKKIRFIYPKKNFNSNLVMIESVKATGKGLVVNKPLIVHNEDGTYTQEIINIFKGVID